jgi:hypothetical protein
MVQPVVSVPIDITHAGLGTRLFILSDIGIQAVE